MILRSSILHLYTISSLYSLLSSFVSFFFAFHSKWALAGLPAIASYINEIHQRHLTLFDKVVFTQDWLPHGSPFLVKDSFGAQLIHALDIPKNVLTFTKSSDDWLNRLGPTDNCTYCDKSYDGEYHFALNGERAKGLPVGHPTLDQYLTSYGYPPEETRLVVTGIAENRCVMKGSVHAVNLGYKDVILYLPGTGATNVTTEENWDPKKNAPEDSCELTLGVSECTEEQEMQWRSEVYTGYKGGPTSDDAVKIMKNALEKIATTKEELFEMMK